MRCGIAATQAVVVDRRSATSTRRPTPRSRTTHARPRPRPRPRTRRPRSRGRHRIARTARSASCSTTPTCPSVSATVPSARSRCSPRSRATMHRMDAGRRRAPRGRLGRRDRRHRRNLRRAGIARTSSASSAARSPSARARCSPPTASCPTRRRPRWSCSPGATRPSRGIDDRKELATPTGVALMSALADEFGPMPAFNVSPSATAPAAPTSPGDRTSSRSSSATPADAHRGSRARAAGAAAGDQRRRRHRRSDRPHHRRAARRRRARRLGDARS